MPRSECAVIRQGLFGKTGARRGDSYGHVNLWPQCLHRQRMTLGLGLGVCNLPAPGGFLTTTVVAVRKPRATTSREVHIGHSGGLGRFGRLSSIPRFYAPAKSRGYFSTSRIVKRNITNASE